ncbi:MAG: hypothetical protein WBK99_07115 [Solirubrobacterales bacterium]
MMKAEKVKTLSAFSQVHDPRLGLLEFKAHLDEELLERIQSALRLAPRLAHHYEIVGVATQCANSARLPLPVEPVEVDVAEQRRDRTALRRDGDAAPDRPLLHHSCAQHRSQEFQQAAIGDSFLARVHQPIVRDRLKTRGDVRLDNPPRSPKGLVWEYLQSVVCRPPGPKPK